MALFKNVVEAYIASRELDKASLSRLDFWTNILGDHQIAEITPEDIDVALVRLTERGKFEGWIRDCRERLTPLVGPP